MQKHANRAVHPLTLEDAFQMIHVSPLLPKVSDFASQNLVFAASRQGENGCDMTHAIKSGFWGVLGIFWRRFWGGFGMHDGGTGKPNSVFGRLKSSLRVNLLSDVP